ncbi:MAG: gephyrin-like molybdotransferase Glp [Syntrophorhabdus sp.]
MPSSDCEIKRIRDSIKRLGSVKMPLLDCSGYVAAEDVHADFDLPQSAISSFDGYAVRSKDIEKATQDNPAVLSIIATTRAGHPSHHFIKPGTAIRIMTGSVLPMGADCVVRFEDTDEPGDKKGSGKNSPSRVKVCVPIQPGNNIRFAGSIFRRGTLLVQEGTIIGPEEISSLASLGKEWITVIRRPVVGIIATGDELVNPGRSLSIGKTYNCNTAATACLVMRYGGIPLVLGIARDTEAALMSKIRKGMAGDAIVISGGAAKGDYDLVRLVLEKIGEIVFSVTKTGSGAAVALGLIKRPSVTGPDAIIPVFSLPGSPAGCLINFETLVRPALLKMLGLPAVFHPSDESTAADLIMHRATEAFVKHPHLHEAQDRHTVAHNSLTPNLLVSAIITEGKIRIGGRMNFFSEEWHRQKGMSNVRGNTRISYRHQIGLRIDTTFKERVNSWKS